jgi:signal transduction histidine kinase
VFLHAEEFVISIKDNGKGFDVNKLQNVSESLGGNGFKNMQARAEGMKAGLTIHSIINTGTTVKLKLKV